MAKKKSTKAESRQKNKILLVKWVIPRGKKKAIPRYKLVTAAHVQRTTSKGYTIATPQERKEWEESQK